MSKASLIPFQGGVIEAVLDAQGKPWVVLRRLCDNLGIDADSQRKRLTDEDRSPWATTVMMTVVAADSKPRDQFCLDLPTVGLWLATIESSRVREEVRATLVIYQKECASTLYDRFFGAPRLADREELRAVVREVLREEREELLTGEEVAARLGMPLRTFWRRVAAKDLRELRVGMKWPWPLIRERL